MYLFGFFRELKILLIIFALGLILLFSNCGRNDKYFEQISWGKEEFLREYPIFSFVNNSFILRPGTYNIDDNIVVPKGFSLRIEAGAKLKMGKGIWIVSYSPVEILGTDSQPVFILAQDKSNPWGVFAIQESPERSVVQYAKFENGSEAIINGGHYSGMLAAHYSDIEVADCIFQDANGNDALNVKNARAIITNNYFYKNKFDAIDLDDGAEGEIDSNYFVDNGDDSIDLAIVSNLMVKNNYVRESGGLCLGIDGKSENVVIFNNLFKDCVSGISLVDNSRIKLINNTIIGNQTGIVVSMGEPILYKAELAIYNTIIWDNGQSIISDEKSNFRVTNSSIKGGWPGDNNLESSPNYDDNYISSLGGGDSNIVNTIFNQDYQAINLGIISPAWSRLPF
ncbi:right-handed parallel beta-helix repeat-containing protein [Patescibacteria group bacterium]|nr:right-handed parallel beta-helix repeat-containing protein [Patescibacteria group bacterium]MBU4512790.1 right-handed parallel beta-helix repeat-containing protein [Patescibacteria group bacterium]